MSATTEVGMSSAAVDVTDLFSAGSNLSIELHSELNIYTLNQITNPDPTTGGEDPEDPDTVRTRVSQSLRMSTTNRNNINNSVEQLEFATEVTEEINIVLGDDSLSRLHYFNGRFLSADDLDSGSSNVSLKSEFLSVINIGSNYPSELPTFPESDTGSGSINPILTSKFDIEIEGINESRSREIISLSIETEIFEIKEGGLNSYVHKFATRVSTNITGAFKEVVGIDAEITVVEYQQGGDIDVRRRETVSKISINFNLPDSDFIIDSFFDVYVEFEPDDDSSVPIITSELSMNLTVRTQDDNETNEESYKVKVKFPWLHDSDDETSWSRIGVLIGGGDFGSWFLPEVDDEVLVLFEQGDPRVPIVIGAIWNGKDEPPQLPEDFEVEVEYAIESRNVLKTYFSVDRNNITLNEAIKPIDIPGLEEYQISLDIDDLEAGIPPIWDLSVDYISKPGSFFYGEIEENIEIITEDDHAKTNLSFTITTYEVILDPKTGRIVKQVVAINEIFVDLLAIYEEDPSGGKSSEVKTMTLTVKVNRIEMA
jgi:hypothetical protein